MIDSLEEKVDLCFRITGKFIPTDHAYPLYAAISSLLPFIHEAIDIGIHPINGKLAKDRQLLLTRRSRLVIRLKSEDIHRLLPLVGRRFSIAASTIVIGAPLIQKLLPRPHLYSRLVVIKGYTEPEKYMDAVRRQLQSLDVNGRPFLVEQKAICKENESKKSGSHSPYLRRTVRIKEKEIVGFALHVDALTAEESLLVQEKGLGGRRRFGCGLFVPVRY